MKFTEPIPILFLICARVAGEVLPRSFALNGAEFSSRSYDYIVVGGGTAGLVVAARLSEDPNISVGVIEGGEYMPDDSKINAPASAFQLSGNPKYDWLFKSTPQPHLKDRVIPLARGKALGGSSAINIMVLDRAPKEEYDAWDSLGNRGWNWAGLLPYMKAAEHFTGVDPFRSNSTEADTSDILPSQGTKGPIAASYNSWYTNIIGPCRRAAINLGIPVNLDPDSGNPFGLYNSPAAVNSTTGKRSYSAVTYYAYNAHRPNMVVLTGARATKVRFKNSTTTTTDKFAATGVSFIHNSTTFTVSAKREVILSTGTFQTPQLLELSGIGNSTILRQHGITPLLDLPGVGENLQDHPVLSTNYELKPGFTTRDLLRNNATYAAIAQAQYNTTHDGILTSSSGSSFAFIDLDYIATSKELARATSQLNREIMAEKITPLQRAQYEIQRKWLKKRHVQLEIIFFGAYSGIGTPQSNTSYLGILLSGQHPFSRGNIHINSSDPLSSPLIDPNYLSKTFDQDVLVQAIRFSQKIANTEPLASFIVTRESPGPEATSDADLIEFVKSSTRSIGHPIGTAAMAPRNLGGVVDTDLRVYGTSNLRIVDASIIPLHISAHISRTVYGIAEKASEIIKQGK